MRLLLLTCVALINLMLPAKAQDSLYSNARALVERVQTDLRHAARLSRDREKERERIDNAQHHLSEFDRELARNKFDKDKLDDSINDVKNVVENNTLDPRDRDILTRDLQELRNLRQTRGAGY